MPVITETSICNGGLIKLGADPISSLSEDVKNARLCNARYEFLRNEVLESHPWVFATKIAELASVVWTSNNEWQYKFALPTDYLQMQRGEDWKQDFEVFDGYLYANESPIKIKYTAEITAASRFSTVFAECLSWRIAAELAYAITNSNTVAEQMMKAYMLALKEARYADAHKRSPEGPVVDSFIDVRN